MRKSSILLIAAFSLLMACIPKMKDTTKPASASTWDAIVANAQKAGLQSERKDEGSRDGKYFWYVKVAASGGTIYYTKNNSSGKVAFACDGVNECDKQGLALINGQ
jgi:hypothetical protein